ncbi:transmembrane and coiled-coil domain-containing protein 4 isoform X3 [Strigops habroptila]|uniref:transmembrane and coiled-coil domain-containing protein 4 isoform X3 n=1 Tax=Strigops habroptila TaxID=2489341 RepID=UPI0011CFF3CE|nr:transmembrane and coiled-coil domain-containing protein 4 isoform X3 [Strigops habroptila]
MLLHLIQAHFLLSIYEEIDASFEGHTSSLQVKMAADEKWKRWASKQHSGAGEAGEKEPCVLLGQQLAEPGRFAYAALCGISLAWLFPEEEQSSFRTGFIEDFVKWLDLPDAVLSALTAFANGLGAEGTETFAQLLLQDPILKENPVIITQDLLSFSLRDGHYDARARVLICHITLLLRIPLEELEVLEESLLESLKEQKEEESETAKAARKKKERRKKLKRYLLIGLATVGGGTVIGLTGGLAAPLVAAGAATVIGSAGAAALGSTAGIAVIASLFGAAGAGLTGYKMKKRVGAIEEFEFLPLTEGKQLHITIAITGWLCTGKYGSFTAPWSSMLQSSEQYCLAWESKYLMELGNALDSLLNGFVNMMAQEALKFTVLSGQATCHTDWLQSGCKSHLLLPAGNGSRKRGDWLLRFVYRTSSAQINVAGLQPVDLDDRRMGNVDLSFVVNGHLDYMKQMDTILKAVGIKTKEEKGSGSLSSPPARKSEHAAGSGTREEEGSGQEEEDASEAVPASAHCPDPPSPVLGGTKEQAAGEGAH